MNPADLSLGDWLRREAEKAADVDADCEAEYKARAAQADALIEIVDRYVRSDNGIEDELTTDARAALSAASANAQKP